MRRSLLLLLWGLFGCRAEPAPAPTTSPRAHSAYRKLKIDPALVASGRVATRMAERRHPRAELKLPGEVRPSLEAAEVGALVAGRVASVLAVEGARVERGQALAWIDAPEVARATADILRARARAHAAGNQLARQLELEDKQATSQSALDEARTEAEVARADLLAARTLLRSLGGVEPKDTGGDDSASVNARVALRAPATGIVVRRDAVLGGAVTPERTLFWLSGEAPAFVTARVPEGIPAPNDGEPATVESRVSSLKCTATVRGKPGIVDRDTRSRDVRLEPEATCSGLIPGAYVDVTFARWRADAEGLVIPREALAEVHGASLSFVLENDAGEVSVRPLRVAEQAGPEVLVESGIEAGERVVVAGAVLLKGELLRAELSGEAP